MTDDLSEALDVIDQLLDFSRAHTGHSEPGEDAAWERAHALLRRHREPPDAEGQLGRVDAAGLRLLSWTQHFYGAGD